MNKQDRQIMLALINSKTPLTRYALAQETGISLPQIQYRLQKLLEAGVATESDGSRTIEFDIHPAFRNINTQKAMAKDLHRMLNRINSDKATPPEGLKIMIDFFMGQIKVLKDSNNSS